MNTQEIDAIIERLDATIHEMHRTTEGMRIWQGAERPINQDHLIQVYDRLIFVTMCLREIVAEIARPLHG